MDKKNSTIIFDDDCSLCRQFTLFLKRWDTKQNFQFLPLQDPEVYNEFPQLSREQCEQAIHLVDSDGNVFVGADIIEPLLKSFPKVKGIVWMLKLPGVKTASHIFYEFVAEHRQRLSKLCAGCGKR